MEIKLKDSIEALSRPGVVNRTLCMRSLTQKYFAQSIRTAFLIF